MMQSRRMPLIQSVIMSRMFSIGYALLAEQVRQQGDELHTNQGNTAARHELFHSKIGETTHGGRRRDLTVYL